MFLPASSPSGAETDGLKGGCVHDAQREGKMPGLRAALILTGPPDPSRPPRLRGKRLRELQRALWFSLGGNGYLHCSVGGNRISPPRGDEIEHTAFSVKGVKT